MPRRDMTGTPDPKTVQKRRAKATAKRKAAGLPPDTNPLVGGSGDERHEQVLRRERDMIELRFGGASLAAIAEHYSLAESTTSTIIKRGLMRMKRERAEMRELELGRLDKIVRAYWEDALGIDDVTPDGQRVARRKDARSAAVVVQAIRERVKIGQLDTIDDDGPSETPKERGERVADQMAAYLAGRSDQQSESVTNGDGSTP